MPPKRISRNGCRNCKLQKVKCDENRPSCLRCLRGRQKTCIYEDSSPRRTTQLRWKSANKVSEESSAGSDCVQEEKTPSPPNLTIPKRISSESSIDVAHTHHEGDSIQSRNLASSAFDQSLLWEDALIGADCSHFLSSFDDFDFGVAEPFPTSIDVTNNNQFSSHPFTSKHTVSRVEPSDQSLTRSNESPRMIDWTSARDPQSASFLADSPSDDAITPLNRCLRIALASSISDVTTLLVDFYFQHLAPLFCCSKDVANPFVSYVKQYWTDSSGIAIAYAIQSMSLACLARSMPGLHRAAHLLREKCLMAHAEQQGQETFRIAFNKAFTLILVGTSNGWFQPRDYTTDAFRQYKTLLTSVQARVFETSSTHHEHEEYIFLKRISTYWGMYLSFMKSVPQNEAPEFLETSKSPCCALKIDTAEIHPWTGISEEVCDLLRRTGLLVRGNRDRAMRPFTDGLSEHYAEELDTAIALERRLKSISFAKIDSYQWQKHLQDLAEAYRQTALLQLYRTFPELLQNSITPDGHEEQPSLEAMTTSLPLRMAVDILKTILSIPPDVHSLRFQLIPLIAASCELGIDPQQDRTDNGSQDRQATLIERINVAQVRTIVMYRLDGMRRVFPGDRMGQMKSLVREVWKRLDYDASKKRPFWIDVAIENDWDMQ